MMNEKEQMDLIVKNNYFGWYVFGTKPGGINSDILVGPMSKRGAKVFAMRLNKFVLTRHWFTISGKEVLANEVEQAERAAGWNA